jgi:myosin light chain 6
MAKSTQLSDGEVELCKEAFGVYEMFFGDKGTVDAIKTADILRAMKLCPTIKSVNKVTGVTKAGEKKLTIEEFMPIYAQLSKEKDVGGYADFMEAMLVFDKESNGTIIAAELRHLLLSLGEKMTESEVDEILKLCSNEDTEGNTKYEDFIKKVLEGPFPNEND